MVLKGGQEEVFQDSSGKLSGEEPWKATLSTEFLKFLKLSNISASLTLLWERGCWTRAAFMESRPRDTRSECLAQKGRLAYLKNPRFNSGCDTIRTAAHIH